MKRNSKENNNFNDSELLAEREGRAAYLVDDSEDVESGNGAGVLRRLTLLVVEVGRDGDHGVLHCLAEVGLGGLLQNEFQEAHTRIENK